MPDEPTDPNAPTLPVPPAPEPDDLDVGEPGDDGRYPAEIVQRLRHEAAERRTRARDAERAATQERDRAERLAERLLRTAVEQAAPGLAEPSELLLHVDAAELIDDDGMPDPEMIKAAAAELLVKKPHLASRKPTGDIDQGARLTTPEPVDLSSILRSAAG